MKKLLILPLVAISLFFAPAASAGMGDGGLSVRPAGWSWNPPDFRRAEQCQRSVRGGVTARPRCWANYSWQCPSTGVFFMYAMPPGWYYWNGSSWQYC